MTGEAPAWSIARFTRWAAQAHEFPAPALREARCSLLDTLARLFAGAGEPTATKVAQAMRGA